MPRSLSRRGFLRRGATSLGAVGVSLAGGSVAIPTRAQAGAPGGFGALQPADGNGLMLPLGFSSRVVAVTGQFVADTSHSWHIAPDGGATFETQDGGWIYVSNSERTSPNGGVGALRFAWDGAITDAYSILTGTNRNCAGGPTPWGTWLSCEETSAGEVYECDPFTPGSEGVARPALGVFNHEAAAVDPVKQVVYLTEDRTNSLIYRFTPTSYPDLTSGVLEAAEILDPGGDGPIAPGEVRPLAWHVVPDPSATFVATRSQVPDATPFNGGEGCWHEAGLVYISTKGSNRIWCLDSPNDTIEILYDLATTSDPHLSNVDNVYVCPQGVVYVAEDPGNLEIVALSTSGLVEPIVRVTGVSGTEITGPCLSPDGTRLYFSSQRNPGTTYEVSGPFAPVPGVPGVSGPWSLMLAAALGGLGALAARRALAAEEND
jgi:secreted PhoX family phosphatase